MKLGKSPVKNNEHQDKVQGQQMERHAKQQLIKHFRRWDTKDFRTTMESTRPIFQVVQTSMVSNHSQFVLKF